MLKENFAAEATMLWVGGRFDKFKRETVESWEVDQSKDSICRGSFEPINNQTKTMENARLTFWTFKPNTIQYPPTPGGLILPMHCNAL